MPSIIEQIYNYSAQNNVDVGLIFEEAVKVSYQSLLNRGDKAIDIGAHKGSHLFGMASSVGRNGKVYAFEPIPLLFKRLKKQKRKRHLSQVKLYQCALGLNKAKTSFQYFHKFPAYSGLNRRDTPFNDQDGQLEEITVKQTKLDQVFWLTQPNIDYIKLDIEGGELHALMGGQKLLARSRPVIVFEGGAASAAQTYGYTKDDFFSFFEQQSMSVYTIDGQPFTRETWNSDIQYPCWEFVAIPNEKKSIIDQFPGFCMQAIENLSNR